MSRRGSLAPSNRCHRGLKPPHNFREGTRENRFPRHKNHLNPRRKAVASPTVSFSKSSPRLVSAHRAPNLPAYGKSGFARSVPRTPKQDKLRTLDPLTFPKNGLKLAAPPEPLRPGERSTAHRRIRTLRIALDS